MKIGVYVGSFNPVHHGHVQVVSYIKKKKYVDQVIVIPTGAYWSKQNLASYEDRGKMLSMAFQEQAIVDCQFSTLPYTYQIMNALAEKFPQDHLYLIIAADGMETFHLWKEVDQILEHHVIVANRDGIDASPYVNQFEKKDRFIILNDFVSLPVSSTEIRNQISTGHFDSIKHVVNEKVLKFISENNLYCGKM